MTREVVLFAIIGPNPAPVSEAIWALRRQRADAVVEAHVVTLEHGQRYLEAELLGAGGALSELRALLPDVLPLGDAAVIAHRVVTDDGAPLADDSANADGARYAQVIWSAARACLSSAGSRPVVHLLAAGRLRTMTAYATTVFQLLARPGDELLDVRVSDRRAEGGSGFFFPEQRARIVTDHGVLDPGTVAVHLVPVLLPRLGRLLAAADLTTFERAGAASQRRIDEVGLPTLRIDLVGGRAFADDVDLELTCSQLVYYTALARQRRADPDPAGGWLPAQIEAELPTLVPELKATADPRVGIPWREDLKDQALRWVFGLERDEPTGLVHKDNLVKLRTDLKTSLTKRLVASGRAAWSAHLVHEHRKMKGASWHRLALPAERIEVVSAA